MNKLKLNNYDPYIDINPEDTFSETERMQFVLEDIQSENRDFAGHMLKALDEQKCIIADMQQDLKGARSSLNGMIWLVLIIIALMIFKS